MFLNPIKKYLYQEIKKVFLEEFNEKELNINFQVEEIKNNKFGDYASNIAMIHAKTLKRNPKELAEKIIEILNIRLDNKYFEKIEIAGPGFINFFLKTDLLIQELQKTQDLNNEFWKPNIGKKKKVVIEYSQPNIAKPLGVHHLLSTIIGQSLSNIYDYLNFEVIRVNHIGDWGTQFGKLIYAYKTWGNREIIDKNPINELLKLYIKFHNEAEKNKDLEDKGREEFKKIENGDKENLELWRWIREISLDDVKKTYKKLEGITFEDKDYIGESFYNDKMNNILEEGKRKGVFKLSEGAFIARIDENTTPLIVQKKDGTTIYATRDLAQIKYRSSLDIVKNLMVVDVAQTLHFKQCFFVAKKLGLNKNKYGNVELQHIVFGRMSLPEKKMSTRKGNVILLNDVLDESICRAEKLINDINPGMPEEKKKNLARISGLGSVKYNILSQNRIHNITFIWDNMIALEGNSAPYLQYTHARANSILNKNTDKISLNFEFTEDIEKTLFKKILNFPDTLVEAFNTNMPHHIATYIYELATIFNRFYNSAQILKTEGNIKNTRITLVRLSENILKCGLNLLVIEAPEEM